MRRVSFPFEEPRDFWKVEDESLGFGECPAGHGRRAVRGREEWDDEIIVRRRAAETREAPGSSEDARNKARPG